MIIDNHVHPLFEENVQELSTTPEGRLVIQAFELTSKNYFGIPNSSLYFKMALNKFNENY